MGDAPDKRHNLKCHYCGKFIGYHELLSGVAEARESQQLRQRRLVNCEADLGVDDIFICKVCVMGEANQ